MNALLEACEDPLFGGSPHGEDEWNPKCLAITGVEVGEAGKLGLGQRVEPSGLLFA
jgi:hypothetical protein